MAKKKSTIDKKFTKSQIVEHIVGETELTKAQVNAVLDSLGDVINLHIKKRSCGEFVLPGLLKITTVKKPARKARKGINPFTGEETTFAAKPATVAVKVRPLKKMKEFAVS